MEGNNSKRDILRALTDVEALCDHMDFSAWMQVELSVPRTEVALAMGMTEDEVEEARERVRNVLKLYLSAQKLIDDI